MTDFGHAWRAENSHAAKHEDTVGIHRQVIIVDSGIEVLYAVENHHPAAVLEKT